MSTLNPVVPGLDLDAIAFALAFNHVGEKRPVLEVLARHAVTPAQFAAVRDAPLFKRSLKKYEAELKADGTSFRLKARVQAEELLKKNWEIIYAKDTPAAIAMKGIENVVRWAGLEPKKDEEGSGRANISISIDLGDKKEEVIIDGKSLISPQLEEKRDSGGALQ